MFGLKIVNAKKYADLQDELTYYKGIVSEKDSVIANLEGELKGLRSEVSRLEKKVESQSASKKKATKDVILLTDVAETPLTVEKKTIRRRTTRKPTSKKKAVTKVENGE